MSEFRSTPPSQPTNEPKIDTKNQDIRKRSEQELKESMLKSLDVLEKYKDRFPGGKQVYIEMINEILSGKMFPYVAQQNMTIIFTLVEDKDIVILYESVDCAEKVYEFETSLPKSD